MSIIYLLLLHVTQGLDWKECSENSKCLCSQAAEGSVALPAEPSKETFEMNTQETNAH